MSNHDDWLTSFLIKKTLSGSSSTGESDLLKTLRDFLEVLDALDRLIANFASSSEQPQMGISAWIDQSKSLRRQMLIVFERAGITFLDCIGQQFDPSLHHAVEVVKRQDVEDNMIVEEISRGCMWKGKLFRFAKVVVVRNSE